MVFDADKYHRSSIRLRDYDCAQEGAYFVTICTRNRECVFGEIADGEMSLNHIGIIVRDEWLRSASIRREIRLEAFVVMPNHVHGIVFILDGGPHRVGATGGRPPVPQDNRPTTEKNRATAGRPYKQRQLATPGPKKRSLASFIGGFKSACTRSLNESEGRAGIVVWQRNYYEHIIRNERSLTAIREYIEANPFRWQDDPENPDVIR